MASNAQAELFKCISDGNVTFQDEPCDSNPAKTSKPNWVEDIAERDRINMEVSSHRKLQAPVLSEEEQANKRAIEKMKTYSFMSSDDLPFEVKLGIRKHLRQTLRDPGSLEDLTWNQVLKMGDKYRVWITYRAKNGFGGYAPGRETYNMNSDGDVLFLGIN